MSTPEHADVDRGHDGAEHRQRGRNRRPLRTVTEQRVDGSKEREDDEFERDERARPRRRSEESDDDRVALFDPVVPDAEKRRDGVADAVPERRETPQERIE